MTLCSRILSITTSLYQVGVYICLSLDIFHMEKAICPTKQHYFGIVFLLGYYLVIIMTLPTTDQAVLLL